MVKNSAAIPARRVYIALVHYPVLNRQGDTIASAVTNLDLHDIARAAKTYGVARFFVVTPLADQQQLARRIVEHWTTGRGPAFNEKRAQAFALIRLKDTLSDVMAHLSQENGRPPAVVLTSARHHDAAVTCDRLRTLERDLLLVFGTGWGIAPELIQYADYMLTPIDGVTGYNHLSVRSAVSIILDRLIQSDVK
ncbi:MAG: RNA methyltransferase [Thermodesulfobacteriota bacterium]|nr:RNA methyltransferase [Thermodesulfobacteriota bacterium]